jgi:WS/DGAT/MGAT family acyltransferase
MSKRLSFLDRALWLTENKHNPKHVAGFHLMTMPDDADQSYCTNLVADAKKHTQAFAPFDCRVVSFSRIALSLKKVESLDMDYHVKHHKIADISDMHALHKFAAKLHEPMLDRDKPLWQMHIIEGEKGKQFAIYFTIHHIYGDGASLVKWFQESYQNEPSSDFVPAWATKRKKHIRPKKNAFVSFFANVWHFIIAVFDIAIILLRLLLKLLRIYPVYMPIPFSGTKTVLTGQVTSGRVIATTDISFEEIKALSRRLRASANEVILCCFDIGIHKFLTDHGQEFDRPLYTQMPINMRRPNDPVGGNKIAIVPVQLAHGKKDPYLRLRQIIENHRIVKGVAKRVYPTAFSYYTVLIQGMAMIFEMLNISALFKPLGNILISNVPGPKQTLYFKDSRLDALYPISTITPGGGVNITFLTYNDTANIGLVCCDKDIKELEPMAEYFKEAFELLKQCIDDPSLTTDDLGEIAKTPPKSILEDHFHSHPEIQNLDNSEINNNLKT